MGLSLFIDGAEPIKLWDANLTSITFETDTPDDSNARSTDVANSLIIKGKILTAIDDKTADDTVKLANWSLIDAEKAESYRPLTAEIILADKVVRNYFLPNAFIVDFNEDFSDSTGAGEFTLVVRQKKDLKDDIVVTGNYDAPAE